MITRVRTFLAIVAGVFVGAALVHAGVLLVGYEHREARIAESVIAAVLLAGLIATYVAPASSLRIGFVTLGFALLGTLMGAVMIAVGVGPRSTLDYALHTMMIVLLISGLISIRRTTR